MGNATGIWGLILALFAGGFILASLRYSGWVLIGLPFALLALILSIVGIATNDSKVPGILGLILAIMVTLTCIAVYFLRIPLRLYF